MKEYEKSRSVKILGPDGRVNGIMDIPGDPMTLEYAGKTYRFSFHWYLGPSFINKDGSERQRYPGVRNKWWQGFSLWCEQGKKTENGRCIFIEKEVK